MQRMNGYEGRWRTALFCFLGALLPSYVLAATLSIGGTGAAIGTMRLMGKAFEKAQPQGCGPGAVTHIQGRDL